MSYKYQNSRYGWEICILILLFIFSPVLSTQADAHPGALYVVLIVAPVFFIALIDGLVRSKAVNLYVVLLFLFALFSTLISEKGCSNSGLLKYLVFVIFFISTSSFVLTPNQLRFSFVSYLYLSIGIAVLIILSFIYGYQHIEASAYQGRYSVGITGIFKNPNYLSSFYNVAFFVVSYIIVTLNISLRKRLGLYSILCLFFVATFFTGTRAALLTEAFVLFSFIYATTKRKHLYKLIALVIIIVVVIAYYWSTLTDLYNLFVAGREIANDTIRENSWNYALKYIIENPILGCGHNSWSVIHLERSGLDVYLHNIFLELFLDQGVIGCMLVVFIIFADYNKTKFGDRFFLKLLLFFTGFPMLFQNGLYEVNFWRFIIINRLMINVSISYKGGIHEILEGMFGNNKRKIV